MIWHAISLRSKLLFLSMSGLVVLSIFAFMQMEQSFSARQASAQNEYKLLASSIGLSVSSAILDRYSDIQSFAVNSAFQQGNKEQIIQVLNAVITSHAVYDAIIFVDSNGNFVASNTLSFDGRALDNRVMEGRSFAETAWFRAALRSGSGEEKTRLMSGVFVEDPQIDPISSSLYASSLPGVSFSKAVQGSDGRTIGVITTRASLRFFENVLRAYFENSRADGTQSTHLMLLTKDGRVAAEVANSLLDENGDVKRNAERILRWNVATQQSQVAAQEAVTGRSGALFELDRVGRVERLWGFFSSQALKSNQPLTWSLILSATSEEVIGDLIRQKRFFYFALAVFVFCLGLLGYGSARALAREYAEFSLKLKDDAIRLLEISDELRDVLSKGRGSTRGTVVSSEFGIEGIREFIQRTTSSSVNLSEAAQALKAFLSELTLASECSEKVIDDIRHAEVRFQEFNRLFELLQSFRSKISEVNGIVLKGQSLGFDSSFETTRNEQNINELTAIATEVPSLSASLERVSKEITELVNSFSRDFVETKKELGKSFETWFRNAKNLKLKFENVDLVLSPAVFTMEACSRLFERSQVVFKHTCETLEKTESDLSVVSRIQNDLNRHVQKFIDQSHSIGNLAQELSYILRGGRIRQKAKRGSSSFVFQRSSDLSPELMRANAVDLLAQKMRRKLSVKVDDLEQKISQLSSADSLAEGGNESAVERKAV